VPQASAAAVKVITAPAGSGDAIFWASFAASQCVTSSRNEPIQYAL
jgi:hypothetical protein